MARATLSLYSSLVPAVVFSLVALALALTPARNPPSASTLHRHRVTTLTPSLRSQWRNLLQQTKQSFTPTQRLDILVRPVASALALREAQVLSPEGTVLAGVTTDRAPSRCPPEIIALDTSVSVSSERVVLTLDAPCESSSANPNLRKFLPLTLFALGLALSFALFHRALQRLNTRITQLTAAADLVSSGQLDVRLRPVENDPLAPLVTAFNTMTVTLSLSRSRVDYLSRIAGWQDLARRLAHEIKNPLTPIQLAVQELSRRYSGDDPRFANTLTSAREIIEEEVSTLRRLVSAFSDFAKLPDVSPTPGDLADFVRELSASRELTTAGSAVTFHFSAGERPLLVFVDRVMFRTAVENVLKNAVEALSARNTDPTKNANGDIWVRCESGNNQDPPTEARLIIEDNGPGISPEHREKIFDPYFTTKGEHGTGLGLAIVRKIALDHDGDVGCEERPGGGARFVFVLPLREGSRTKHRSFVTFTRS